MRLETPSSDCRLGRPSAGLVLGLLAAAYLTGCLLPSEPPEAELIQFQLNFPAPLRIGVNGSVQPIIPVLSNGQAIKHSGYRLEVEDQGVARVDETGRVLVGVARGATSVRAVVATAIGERDTVFPVQVVVSGLYVSAQDTGSGGFGNQATLTRLGQTHQFGAIALDARGDRIPDVPFTWSIGDSLVAKLVAPGQVVAVDEGFTLVRAEVDGVQSVGVVVVVQDAAAVRLAPELDTLRTVGRSIGYLALVLDSTNRVINGAKPRWSSTDTNVARVSNLGVATDTGSGTTKIIARVGGAADTATLVVAQVARFLFVSPALLTVTALADTARFTAEARDSSGALMPTLSYSWAVDDTSIATVDSSGLVTARRNGAVIVTVSADRQSAFATAAVRQELAQVRLLEDELALSGEGATGRLHPEGRDRNGYVIPDTDPTAFTWHSQWAVVATVNSAGVVTAHGDGRVWVAAYLAPNGATDTAIVTVSGAPQELIAFASRRGIEVVRANGTNRTVLIARTICDNYYYDYSCSSVGVDGPAWSPDGTRLAFERHTSNGDDIYTAAAGGSDTVNLTRNSGANGQAAWSPDGSKIAFWSNRGGNVRLYVMNADGTNVRFLRGEVSYGLDVYFPGHPTWSPDGARLAFDQACNIHVINADGGGLLTLTTGEPGSGLCSYSPAWSPDGTQLAFVSNRDGTFAIWVMNADGSGAANLTRALTVKTPSDSWPPTWSPLGSQIVFGATPLGNCYYYYYYYNCPGPPHLWVVSRDGTAVTQITDGDGESRPSWRRAAPLPATSGPLGRRP